MAKSIIVLENSPKGRIRAAFWLSVPIARQPFYANAAATSAYKNATGPEIAALTNGSVKEEVGEFVVGGMTNGQIRTMLENELTARQAVVNAHNPWTRYGTFFESNSWTNGGVA